VKKKTRITPEAELNIGESHQKLRIIPEVYSAKIGEGASHYFDTVFSSSDNKNSLMNSDTKPSPNSLKTFINTDSIQD
jgi:hypothetical protein